MSIIVSKRLLSAKEAADYLSISRTTLYYLNDMGKVPSILIKTRRLFDVLELDEYVEKLKTEQRKNH